ncbi:phage tail sheath subtilisin-like domain-containing protein [Moorena producens JHB]|uniref:Phage tail sheath subtilisin-like domain-containing protein n=1 Tax=Moorena producens (strain JHB) TaxID=1454205 RepID=A0A9Q9SUV9_MOOP1|nr:phage tail sheath C-terminal domain-containing protein [Moorena producens]WAN70106.1 phage tail sheath subtilisin-like domain-containing protein [Moorena producens JHB]
MPVTPTYPGVYVEEIPSGVRTITGVATSITAFIGRAKKGATNDPILINSYGEYERIFGGLWNESTMGFAVRDFYTNGGSQAVIVRLFNPGEMQATDTNGVFETVSAIKTAADNDTEPEKNAGIEEAKNNHLDNTPPPPVSDPNSWPEQNTEAGKIAKDFAIEMYNSNVWAAVDDIKNAGNEASGITAAKRHLDNKDPRPLGEPKTWPYQNTERGQTAKEIAIELHKLQDVIPIVTDIQGTDNKEDAILAAQTYLDSEPSEPSNDPNTWPEQTTVPGKIAKEMAININELSDNLTGDDYKEEVDIIIGNVLESHGLINIVSAEDYSGRVDIIIESLKIDVSDEKYTKDIDKIVADLQIRQKAQLSVGETDNTTLLLEAANEGSWGNELRARVDYNGLEASSPLFNLSVRDGGTGEVETFQNLSVDENETRYIKKVLEKDSQLVRMLGNPPSARPEENPSTWEEIEDQIDEGSREEEKKKFKAEGVWYELCSNGVEPINRAGDGDPLESNNFTEGEGDKTGIYALEKADLFNLLCIPPYKQAADGLDVETGVIDKAIAYCEKRRAMMIIDSPSGWKKKEDAKSGINNQVGSTSKNAAVFFPRLVMPNPLKENQIEVFAACGAVAGIFARTDSTRGVWKAPAGLEAVLKGVIALSVPLTDPENGELNPLGINCLRNRPPAGKIVWGSRTRVGDDMLASEWKYIPVRRLALYLEETLYRNTKWAVFEPNDEPLWSQLRLSIGSFMQNLFKQGAFQGSSPKDAYFVKCDKETTTQYDIDRGIVNIMIGFAPLKPAEFVILKFQQIAGQS